VTVSALWLLSGVSDALPLPISLGAYVGLAIAAVLRDLEIVRFPLPQNQRLIPRIVLRRGPTGIALQFGLELGTGVRTYLTATAPYLVALAIVIGGPSWQGALLAGGGFGLGRTLSFVSRSCHTKEPRLLRSPIGTKAAFTMGCAAALLIAVMGIEPG
jgi:hypothetical protein